MDISKSNFTEKHWPLLLAVIIAAGAALRAAGLSRNVFYIDEAFSYMLASHDLRGILRGAMSESNPPLPMLIFHVWQMFGRAEVFLRIPPLILNVLTIPVVFALGRRMRGTGAGLAAAALFAAAAGMVDLSLIYRYPALLTLLSGLFVLLYFRASASKPVFSLGSLALLVVVEIAGLYTHYFFIFVILGVNLVVLWDAAIAKTVPAKRFAGWFAGQILAAASFAPWIFAFRQQASKEFVLIPLSQSLAHLSHSLFGAIPQVMIGFLFGPIIYREPFMMFILSGLAILVTFLIYAIDKESRGQRYRIGAVLLIILFVPYFMMIFLGLRLQPLYFCIAAPVFFTVLGTGLSGINKPPRKFMFVTLFIVVAFLSSVIYQLTSRPKCADNKAAIHLIESGWHEGDVVVINPTYQASLFQYFAPGKFKLFGIPKDFDIMKYNFNDTTQVTEERLSELDGALGKNGRVWAFMGFGTKTKPDQNEATIRYLREHYKLCKETPFSPASFSEPVGRLYLFERRGGGD